MAVGGSLHAVGQDSKMDYNSFTDESQTQEGEQNSGEVGEEVWW